MRLRSKLLGGILATLLLQIAMTGTFTVTYFLVKTRASLQSDLQGDWEHARAYVEELKHSLYTQLYELAFFLKENQRAGVSPEGLRGMLRYFISLTSADRIVLIDEKGAILADEKAGIGAKDDLPVAFLRPRDFQFPRNLFLSVTGPARGVHLYLVTGSPVMRTGGASYHLYLITDMDASVVDAIREKTGTEVAFFAGAAPVVSAATWELLQTDAPLRSRTIRLGDSLYGVYSRPISSDLPDKVYLVAIRSLLAEGLYVRSVLLSYVMAFLVTLVASVFVAAGVTSLVVSPFTRLSQWLHRYMDTGMVGGLDVRSRDEVGFLAETFHGMVSSLIGEKQVISDQLDQISLLHAYNERIMNSIPAGIVVIDAQGAIEFCNSYFAELAGCPVPALSGRILKEVMGRRFTLRTGETASDVFSPERDSVVEGLKAEVPDGRPLQFTLKISGIALSGSRRGALVVLEDVTASERVWEKMIIADKVASLGILSAGMAHEINNPLGSILSHVDYLKAVEKEEGKRESLGWIESETNRIAALVRRIRAYSAPGDRGDSIAELNQTAKETADVLRFTLEKRRLSLTLDLEHDLPPVICPSDELKQVALNLLLNAYEACADGGIIRVRTARRLDGTAVLGISDNGAGIDPADMKDIFDPFFTTKQSRQGNGLGLSICYTIVKRAGGDIRVSSAPGKGTDVEVVLRVHERPDRG